MSHVARTLNDWIFCTEAPKRNLKYAIFTTLALFSLFAIGVLHWSFFINFGDVAGFHDWGERYNYVNILRESITTQTTPYIVPVGYYSSDRFMANLQVPLSPQILFTTVLRPDHFALFNVLLMYTLGFLGCLLIRRRYSLTLVPFTFLFLLFNFNGSITAHISVGHPWLGYFLLPIFVLLILELVQPHHVRRLGVSILLSLVLVAIVLQGSFHVFVWCALFLALLGLFNRQLLSSTIFVLVSTAFLGLFRFLPAIFFHGSEKPSYASGFPTFTTFIDALTTIKAFTFEHPRDSVIYDVSWHEHDMFIGYLGVAFIVFFGIYLRFHGLPDLQRFRFRILDLPILLVVLFSFGIVTDGISDLRIPLLSFAEQVPSRMFLLPLVFLVVLGSITMQDFLPRIQSSATLRFLTLAALLQLTHSLAAHSWFWRVTNPLEKVYAYSHPTFDAPGSEDFLYTSALKISVAISLLFLVALGSLFYWKVWRVRHDNPAT